MPAIVEQYIRKLQSKGMPESEAIAIGKKQGKIVQQGSHLEAGPTINKVKYTRPPKK